VSCENIDVRASSEAGDGELRTVYRAQCNEVVCSNDEIHLLTVGHYILNVEGRDQEYGTLQRYMMTCSG
jgi:hypothetical protein